MTSETDDTTQAADFVLPSRLDTDTAHELREDLAAMRGGTIRLIATDVGHLGARCLAVLIAAANTWREDGNDIFIDEPSEYLVSSLERMGGTIANITTAEDSTVLGVME